MGRLQFVGFKEFQYLYLFVNMTSNLVALPVSTHILEEFVLFLKKKIGCFEENLNFFKIAQSDKSDVECVSIGIIS